MVAAYDDQGASFFAAKPRLLCDTQLPEAYGQRVFDLHPDGLRFVVFQEVDNPEQAKHDHIVLLENFFDELRRLAPAE
jgi:hypothetical protein